jgi:phenylacetate-coenzyme A ligase PaaK-like adenylate-forming protein
LTDGTRPQELECMPLPQLASFQEERLRQSDVIRRASNSALYKASWQKAGLRPESVRSRADLRSVPYLNGTGLKDAFASHPIESILTSQNVRLWFCTSGTTGSPKWIPYADGDLSLSEQIMLRDIRLCGVEQEKLKWLALTTPAPFVADGAAHIGIFAELLNGLENEHILVVATEADACLELARIRKANVLCCSPGSNEYAPATSSNAGTACSPAKPWPHTVRP